MTILIINFPLNYYFLVLKIEFIKHFIVDKTIKK